MQKRALQSLGGFRSKLAGGCEQRIVEVADTQKVFEHVAADDADLCCKVRDQLLGAAATTRFESAKRRSACEKSPFYALRC